MVYWKETYPYRNSADAEKIGKELDRLKIKSPEKIVEYAKNEKRELHKCFEWDTELASERYWLEQARMLTNHLVIDISIVDEKDNDMEITVNAYSSIPTDDGRQYVKTSDALDNEILKAVILSQVKSYLSQAATKMRSYKILFSAKHIESVGRILEEMKKT